MSMLSRVAERLYWMSRYLERTEDTARVVSAYNHLIMDIPKGAEPGWDIMVQILDAQPHFEQRFRSVNEQNVLKLLVADTKAPCSIPYSIQMVRENVRTTRDVLPEETWELVNELSLFAQESAPNSVGRRNRHAFLAEVISRCQTINGLLLSSLSRDHAHSFTKLGRLLECADMATRMIDVGAGDIGERAEQFSTLDPLLWGALLQGLSAGSAYRREVGPIVDRQAVVNFVFLAPGFPRSVKFCVREIRNELGKLSGSEEALKVVSRLSRRLNRLNKQEMTQAELHPFIDEFQVQLNNLHVVIQDTWFRVDGQ
jgi:uncharacterized alpha-E superfamily protein